MKRRICLYPVWAEFSCDAMLRIGDIKDFVEIEVILESNGAWDATQTAE